MFRKSKNSDFKRDGFIKLERNTSLEGLFTFLIMGALVCALIFWRHSVGGYGRGGYSSPKPEWRAYIPWTLGSAALFIVFRCFTDNFYLLDPQRRQILYHFKFFNFRRIRVRLTSNDILALTVTGRKWHRRHCSGWRYQIIAVDHRGKRVALSDWESPGLLESTNYRAITYASLLCCDAVPCPPEHRLVVRSAGVLPRLDFQPWPFWRSKPFLLLYGLIAFLGGVWLVIRLIRLPF